MRHIYPGDCRRVAVGVYRPVSLPPSVALSRVHIARVIRAGCICAVGYTCPRIYVRIFRVPAIVEREGPTGTACTCGGYRRVLRGGWGSGVDRGIFFLRGPVGGYDGWDFSGIW